MTQYRRPQGKPANNRPVSIPKRTDEASRHGAGHYAGIHPEDTPYLTTAEMHRGLGRRYSFTPGDEGNSEAQTSNAALEEDVAYRARTVIPKARTQVAKQTEEDEPPRMPTSARRYNRTPTPDGFIQRQGNKQYHVHVVDTPPIVRASRQAKTTEEPAKLPRFRRLKRLHWAFFVGLGFLLMLFCWMLLSAFLSWWQIHQDDSTYGRPRTYQTDAVVGHNDSADHPSHFLAINLNRRVTIIEIPGGEVSKSLIYSGPTLVGDGEDLTPITLSFADVNGDGKPDMLVHIQEQVMVWLNDGTKFTPPNQSVFRETSHRGNAI
jgi:hypothetical protein